MKRLSSALLAALALHGAAGAGEVEVLHYWTSGGEAKSIDLLRGMVRERQVSWKDLAIDGEIAAMKTLSARAKAGNAVTAAQMKTPDIVRWGRDGAMANLDAVAAKNNWDALLPKAVADSMKYQGHYAGAPVNVHRENWLYINTEVFAKAGAKVPTTFDEFFEAADKIRAAGMIPIAHGGQPWQDAIMLESVVLGVGGPGFYQKVFVHNDQAALTGPVMTRVFETMGRIRGYLDKYSLEREWNMATSMVIHGKGGMQFMGDWAKGDFVAKGKVPGKDFLCVAAPGTQGAFIYTVDALGMFALKDPAKQQAQVVLAETIMSPAFQEAFNLNKGSIPARSDVPRERFDSCAVKSMDDMAAANRANGLVPSIAMAADADKTKVFHSVSAAFMHSRMPVEEAVRLLADGLRARAVQP